MLLTKNSTRLGFGSSLPASHLVLVSVSSQVVAFWSPPTNGLNPCWGNPCSHLPSNHKIWPLRSRLPLSSQVQVPSAKVARGCPLQEESYSGTGLVASCAFMCPELWTCTPTREAESSFFVPGTCLAGTRNVQRLEPILHVYLSHHFRTGGVAKFHKSLLQLPLTLNHV